MTTSMDTTTSQPPMDPNTDEATAPQLARAREQGEAYGRAMKMMIEEIAETGDATRSGDYEVGYALEDAEGLYTLVDGELIWNEPDENLHVEIVVRDAADGRFIPGLEVDVTLTDVNGREIGPYRQALVWHPMMYHYARNWAVPGDAEYTMKVEIQPPTFPRHDATNGRRFAEPCTVTFEGVTV